MLRRDILAGTALVAGGVALAARPRQAEAQFFGGADPASGAAMVAILQAIQTILDSRFVEMLETAKAIGSTTEIVNTIKATLDVVSQAQAAYYTLENAQTMFAVWKQAVGDGSATGIALETSQLLDFGIGVAEDLAVVQAGIAQDQVLASALSGVVMGLSQGTTSVSANVQIANQLQALANDGQARTNTILGKLAALESVDYAERYKAKIDSKAQRERFLQGFTSDAEMPTIRLPGID